MSTTATSNGKQQQAATSSDKQRQADAPELQFVVHDPIQASQLRHPAQVAVNHLRRGWQESLQHLQRNAHTRTLVS